ncbi:hypothetical protein BO70DRAFT_426733 [Aspergillus heteromorphus CBS 117.55]|uniref:Uncharacterized protein n=1 Tax=Aspergillus heteromorphus CBS 117.55 TaxID=1448321 RepID=A0A317WW72_9EURO|nr:uncharacterized protein BO70DRAFT_426733 [Aspergillus heteromorphus CBS 117.55]PWY89058.1 hypothetical protein BO70DRAFT_426733 [Aspergillus heteromorphus CBS 117.55]
MSTAVSPASPDGSYQPSRSSSESRDVEKQQLQGGRDPNIVVDWDGPDDPVPNVCCLHFATLHPDILTNLPPPRESPRNFSRAGKWTITVVLGLMTVSVTFASSVFSATASDRSSSAPVLLERRAKHLRFESCNWALHARSEERPVDD